MGFKSFSTADFLHNLLSVTHPDTVPASPVQGDLIYGNATPAWQRLGIGAPGQVLGIAAGIPAWSAQSYIDHGSLTGLGDDDHTQYALLAGRAGTNDFTGNVTLTGRLGVGTTGPSYPVHIKVAQAELVLESSTAGNRADVILIAGQTAAFGVESNPGGSLLTGSTANAIIVAGYGNFPLQFGTNATPKMTLLATGELGIGTPTPTAQLSVVKASSGLILDGSIGATARLSISADANFTIFKSPNNRLKLVDYSDFGLTVYDGNVGIKTDSTAVLAALAVNGGCHIGGVSDPGDNNLNVDGIVYVNGKAFTFGANDSAGAGYRTVKIENA